MLILRELPTNGKPIKLDVLDNFVDGASVSQVGEETFKICQKIFTDLNDIKAISNGHICHELLNMYKMKVLF